MAKILITGSEGLIGKALQQALLVSQYEPVLFDHKFSQTNINYGDILDINTIKKKINKCVGIVHLAAVSRVIDGQQNPELCWETNVGGTKNILVAALNSKTKPWVLYASSREVYGQQKNFPVKETSQKVGLNYYAKSKIAAENLVSTYKQKGLSTAIIRFSNVFGSIYDHYDRVVPAFCRAAAYGLTVKLEGRDNLFDFTHVSDTVQGIIKIISLLNNNHCTIPILHLVSGKPTSLLDLAELVQNISEFDLKIIDCKPRNFDVSKFYGDPSRAKEVLNWEHKTTLKEGVTELISLYIKHKEKIDVHTFTNVG